MVSEPGMRVSKTAAGCATIIALLAFMILGLPANAVPTVDPKTYGAYGDGVHDDTAAIQIALYTGCNVAFSAGTYLVHPTLTVSAIAGQIISGTGATLVSHDGSGYCELLHIDNNNCTINGLNFQMDGSVTYGMVIDGMGNTIENCLFMGNVGDYIWAEGYNTTITSNIFYGTGASILSTPIELAGANGFTVTNNQFQDVEGFNVQTWLSRNGTISNNVFRNPTYLSTAISTASQTVFTFTFPVAIGRYGLRLNNTTIGNYPTTRFTATSSDQKTWTVTLLDTHGNAGNTVKFYGWRSLENINMNAGSAHITVTGNSMVGTGDSNIVICSNYDINDQLTSVQANWAKYPIFITASNNNLRNTSAAGVAVNEGVSVSTTTSPWTNLNPTWGWGENVVINSGGQLQVFTGDGEYGYWMPGQTDLTQCSNYHLSWDQGNSGDWSFVQFNSVDTTGSMQCGFLVNGNAVQLFINGSIAQNVTSANPTGKNGLHHLDVTVENGQMTAIIDGAILLTQNLDSVGTDSAGVGSFCIYTEADSAYGYLDNFEYQVIGITSVVADSCNVAASTNPNSDLSARQLGPNYWIESNEISDSAQAENEGTIPWSTCIFDSIDTNGTNGAYVSNNAGYCTVTNIPEYLFTCNTRLAVRKTEGEDPTKRFLFGLYRESGLCK